MKRPKRPKHFARSAPRGIRAPAGVKAQELLLALVEKHHLRKKVLVTYSVRNPYT
jgi:hypothetical protein